MGKGLKIMQTYPAPFSGIVELNRKKAVYVLPPCGVYIGFHLLPGLLPAVDRSNTFVVMDAKLLPQGCAVFKFIVPCYVVEPEQILRGTSQQIVIKTAIRFTILTCGVCAFGRTLEPKPDAVCLMVIYRAPFNGIFCFVAIRFRTIVMIKAMI